LGKVRTEQVKRIANELIRRFPEKFSDSFEDNKRVVDMFIMGSTTRVRNRIAGYITHMFAGVQTQSSSESTEEDTQS